MRTAAVFSIRAIATCQRRARRSLPAVLSLLAFCLLPMQGALAVPLVVLSQDSEIYQDVADAMAVSYGQEMTMMSLAQLRARSNLPELGGSLIVPIGTQATEYLLRTLAPSRRLLACLVPQASWQALLHQHGERWQRTPQHQSPQHQSSQHLSVVYPDQPLQRQVALARQVLPESRILGAVKLSDPKRQAELEAAARQFQFSLQQKEIQPEKNTVRQLQPLIRDSDIFLPVADPVLFNRTTAKWILYIAYRQQVPLVGFSRKYVQAGAVAGVHSSAAQIGRQCGELLLRHNNSNTSLPSAQYPHYFSVSTNRAALRSLHLRLLPDEQLTERLQQVQP